MFSLLKSHIKNRIEISDEEFELCTKFFIPKKIRKRQFFLQEGDTNRNIAFINSGCMRIYTIDDKGAEHIIQFGIADWWVADLNSYLSGLPATYNIDALEDSELLMLEKNTREELLNKIPKMERFFRLLVEKNYIATHQRIVDSLSISGEERYLKFIKTYPEMFEKIPQHQIASYLGLTPQSLSRIRKELSTK
ncbi:MAG: Crp/Fnr family transcriptional regulator [Syntrophothermus sp.]